jgi:hypothetical protein
LVLPPIGLARTVPGYFAFFAGPFSSMFIA